MKKLYILLLFGIIISCTKEKLVSQERIKDFSVDTVFQRNISVKHFFVTDHMPPFTDGQDIYFNAIDEANTGDVLFKIDGNTGATLWTWSDFDPPQPSVFQDVKWSNGMIVTKDLNEVTILINPSTGQTIRRFPFNKDAYYKATYFDDHLYILQSSDASILSLIRYNVSSSQEDTLFTLHQQNAYFTLGELFVFSHNDIPHIAFEIKHAPLSVSSNATSLYVAPLIGNFSATEYGLGNDGHMSSFLSDTENLYVLSSDCIIRSLNPGNSNHLNWANSGVCFSNMMMNNSKIYVSGYRGTYIYEKSSGRLLASNPTLKYIVLATDSYLMKSDLTLYDPQNGDYLMQLPFPGYQGAFLATGKTEFFFISTENKNTTLYKLSVKPKM